MITRQTREETSTYSEGISGGKIRHFSVDIDDGWKLAQLQEPILVEAPVRFRYLWRWNA